MPSTFIQLKAKSTNDQGCHKNFKKQGQAGASRNVSSKSCERVFSYQLCAFVLERARVSGERHWLGKCPDPLIPWRCHRQLRRYQISTIPIHQSRTILDSRKACNVYTYVRMYVVRTQSGSKLLQKEDEGLKSEYPVSGSPPGMCFMCVYS